MKINKTKIAIYLTILVLLIVVSGIIWNGLSLFSVWIEQHSGYYFKGKLGIVHQALAYTAPRLWELSVEKQIEKIFGEDATLAKAVFRAESGLRCDAVSSTADIGIAQINAKYHAWRGNLMDCTQNLLIAKDLKDEQGWGIWVAYSTGAYKK